jgi:methionyl aminopeptidase
MAIKLKSSAEIEKMRSAGQVVAGILDALTILCVPGTRTIDFERRSAELIEQAGAISLFKNYPQYAGGNPYPATVCVSVNEEVVHGIPGERTLVEGDVVSFDFGVMVEGYCGDSARTVAIGKIEPQTQRLLDVTRQALDIAIETIRPGLFWSAVAGKMEQHVRQAGFSVVTDFVGHGIGTEMHEDPKLPNFVSRELLRRDTLLEVGAVLAVEPMVNMGTHHVTLQRDGWTVVTRDGKPSAHFEHTIAVVEGGVDVLTALNGSVGL